MSKQRELVLDIIRRSRKHPTAEEIFFEARKEMPSIALGTVYRNANALAREGAIRRLTMPEAPDRFDAADVPHDHLVCVRCGKLKDVRPVGIGEAVAAAAGEDVITYELNAYYLCEDCKKSTKTQEVKNERTQRN